MHAPTITLLLSLCTFVSALPPLTLPTNSSLLLDSPFNLTIQQNLNHTTTPLAGLRTPTCYTRGHRSPPVDLATCFEIIATLTRTRDFEKRKLWRTNPRRGQAMHVEMGECNMQLIDGADNDVFSVADVVDVMEEILYECQPDVRAEYAGTGGQMGIGRYGFVVRVVGSQGRAGQR